MFQSLLGLLIISDESLHIPPTCTYLFQNYLAVLEQI